jgi:hypothetical protein
MLAECFKSKSQISSDRLEKMAKRNRELQGRNLKQRVVDLLLTDDFNQVLEIFCSFPARRVINPLFSLLCSTEPQIRWHSITAVGVVVANLAQEDMESARVIMRRMMWNLNDESGGIGWGLPEAMGEIMARHEGLALEYANILVSYVRQDGNYLEHPPLQRGVLWGLGRLAQTRPELLKDVPPHLHPFLASKDAAVRALAAWIMGLLGGRQSESELETLLEDEAEVSIYLNGKHQFYRVSDLAKQALAADV